MAVIAASASPAEPMSNASIASVAAVRSDSVTSTVSPALVPVWIETVALVPSASATPLKVVRLAMSSICAISSANRSEEHTSELQSLMRSSYAVFGLKKKTYNRHFHIKWTSNKRQTKSMKHTQYTIRTQG